MQEPLKDHPPEQGLSDPEWLRQDRAAVRDVDGLARLFPLAANRLRGAAEAARRFRMKITPYYLDLMDAGDPACPLVKLAVPDMRELAVQSGELEDPTGDENPGMGNRSVPRMVHRYPGRVLLMPTARCGGYCRHCFRRRLAGKADQEASEDELAAAVSYIAQRPSINEVILSGGDPLMLTDERLVPLLDRLRTIAHVRVLRIHTRMPVVNPHRVTPALSRALAGLRPLWVVLHVNHPREVTPTATACWRLLSDAGLPLLNQTVLLKGVNDSAGVMEALSWRLIEAGVHPYYLHHLDLARGLGHFRVGVRTGIRLMRSLQGRLPGYAIPRYVLDIPGGHGKVPLCYPWLREGADRRLYVESPNGSRVPYAEGVAAPGAGGETGLFPLAVGGACAAVP